MLLWQPEVGQTAMTSLPVHKERLITLKRCVLFEKFQLIAILNRGRSFRIRHFYLPVAPPSGRKRDYSISGLLKSPIARKRW
jgi:hypothetical protein